jgi:hypothetical protein
MLTVFQLMKGIKGRPIVLKITIPFKVLSRMWKRVKERIK